MALRSLLGDGGAKQNAKPKPKPMMFDLGGVCSGPARPCAILLVKYSSKYTNHLDRPASCALFNVHGELLKADCSDDGVDVYSTYAYPIYATGPSRGGKSLEAVIEQMASIMRDVPGTLHAAGVTDEPSPPGMSIFTSASERRVAELVERLQKRIQASPLPQVRPNKSLQLSDDNLDLVGPSGLADMVSAAAATAAAVVGKTGTHERHVGLTCLSYALLRAGQAMTRRKQREAVKSARS